MRKRSGAIHCDTEQEYIRLSILSEKKLGIFYEGTESPKRHDKGRLSQKSTHWEDFDYDKNRQFFATEEEAPVDQIQTLNVMVLYEPKELARGISERLRQYCGQSDLAEKGIFDLVIKQENRKDRKLVTKFWISSDRENTIVKTYIQRADVVIWIRSSDSTTAPDITTNKHKHLQLYDLLVETQNAEEINELLAGFFTQKLSRIGDLGDQLFRKDRSN